MLMINVGTGKKNTKYYSWNHKILQLKSQISNPTYSFRMEKRGKKIVMVYYTLKTSLSTHIKIKDQKVVLTLFL